MSLPCVNTTCASRTERTKSVTGCSAHNWHAVTSCVDYRTLSPTDAPIGIENLAACAGCRPDGKDGCAGCRVQDGAA